MDLLDNLAIQSMYGIKDEVVSPPQHELVIWYGYFMKARST